jgi:hypothetical protein
MMTDLSLAKKIRGLEAVILKFQKFIIRTRGTCRFGDEVTRT